MPSKRYYLLTLAATVTLSIRPGLSQTVDFPIGAWFPGLFDNQSGDWEDRLDLVEAAHFNTIHASLEIRNDAADNQEWMDLAHDRDLKVQLYSWNVPPSWRNESLSHWSQTFEEGSLAQDWSSCAHRFYHFLGGPE